MIQYLKSFTFLFFFFICLFVQAQNATDNNNDKTVELLIRKLRAQSISVAEREQLKLLAFDVQNKGQLLDESLHDYKGSLVLINKAIAIFNALGDDLNEANNRKFKGYLLGRFGKFTEGKKEIEQSMQLFSLKKADWGVAVSQFDLARLYELENKTDSAIFYCNTALSYWKAKGNAGRVFLNQNMLIYLLTKSGELAKAKALQSESEKMAKDPEHHWQALLDFYFVSKNLYAATRELKTAHEYDKLYLNKIAELIKQGIEARSYFDDN